MFALALVIVAIPPGLVDAIAKRAPTGTRAEVSHWSGPRCAAQRYEAAAVEGPGRIAVRAVGQTCSGWGWATVHLFATQAIADRVIEKGEALEGAVRLEEREWKRGSASAPSLSGAVASHRIGPGTVLRSIDVRVGPEPGTNVTVRVVINAITVEQRGTIVSCGQQLCARVSSGRVLVGTMNEGLFVSTVGPSI